MGALDNEDWTNADWLFGLIALLAVVAICGGIYLMGWF